VSFFSTRAGAQAIFIAAFGVDVWMIGVKESAFEQVYAFIVKYDAYQLDDVLLAVIVVGLMSLIYSALRVWDLGQEVGRRNAAEQSAMWIACQSAL
jgi:hypothetical protein